MPLISPLLLAALLVQRAETPPAADSAAARTVPACDAVAASVVRDGAGDLAAALGLHGAVVRWDVAGRPLAVWVQERPRDAASARHPQADWRGAVAEAVAAWSGVAPGLRLAVARDSAAADVRVLWASTLATAPNDPAAGALAAFTAGRTTIAHDAGRAVAATVVLALRAPNGAPYLPRDVRAVARHELGHAVGLAHHASPSSVMAPLVEADRLADGDRAVLRALYELPVGARCAR
jgi:hypothetical protein